MDINAQATISIIQVIALIVINLSILPLIGLIYLLLKQKSQNFRDITIIVIGISLFLSGIILVLLIDVGIYLWINLGNIWGFLIILPIMLCMFPIINTFAN